MDPLDVVRLTKLMEYTSGNPDVRIGLIDGPVAMDHPELAMKNIRAVSTSLGSACTMANSAACQHGTSVAGILCARRESDAPAICPDCTLIVRPIFVETTALNGQLPHATAAELATAIIECIEADARVLNLSVALMFHGSLGHHELEEALNHAARREVIVVAATGNQGAIGGSVITSHPWVIPVVAYDLRGRPLDQSNLGNSIGRRGLGAPGVKITSLNAAGKSISIGGTSAATPFVTGAIALLWSIFSAATAAQIKLAVTQTDVNKRTSVVPPLLNAWAAYQFLKDRFKEVTVYGNRKVR